MTGKISMSKSLVFKIRSDGVMKNTFALYLLSPIITDFIRKSISVGWLPSQIPVQMVRNVLYILCFLMVANDIMVHRKFALPILFFVISLFVIGVSYLLNPDIVPLLPNTLLLLIFRFFPASYFFSYLRDWDERITAVFNWRWGLYAYALLAIVNNNKLLSGYMEIAYNLLCPTLIVLYYAINKKKLLTVAGMIGIALFMMIMGPRGVLFCVFVSALCFFSLSYHKMTNKGRIISTFILIILVFVLALSYSSIMNMVFNRFGFTRNIQWIIEGKFFSDRSANVRIQLFNTCMNEVKEHPLTVRGILTDRVLLSGRYASTISEGYYVHNFFIEILYQFGVVIGGIVLLWFSFSLVRSYRRLATNKNENWNIIYASCAAAIIPFIMLSGSYLTEAAQWFLFTQIAVLSSKKLGEAK